ncbi:MAG: two-component sensor histidine kinase, partial [Streptomyces sp.]|nr:two-component sensor histidine kinase [Streptomyces sp.]
DSGGGHGLLGMRERVTALRGTLTTGPRYGGGFRVHAILPVKTRTTARDKPGEPV